MKPKSTGELILQAFEEDIFGRKHGNIFRIKINCI